MISASLRLVWSEADFELMFDNISEERRSEPNVYARASTLAP